MNIFYLHPDPQTCAEYHANKHCVKMITEHAQLLCTAHRVLDGTVVVEQRYVLGSFPARYRNVKRWKHKDSFLDKTLYGTTHANHPSAIWCRASAKNYQWLHTMTDFLCKEYTYRYGKVHKVERDGLLNVLYQLPTNIPHGPYTEPTPAMPPIYIVPGDSLQSYHNYYNGSKRHLFNWKNRPAPPFIQM